MMPSLRFLHATIVHKWYVYQAGRKLGIGRWQLLIHDLSKFRPAEFVPYGKFFYSAPGSDWLKAVPDAQYKGAMLAGWLKHIQRNPHHWQYHCVVRVNAPCPDQSPYSKNCVANAGSLEPESNSSMADECGTAAPLATTLTRRPTSNVIASGTTPTTGRGTLEIPNNTEPGRKRSWLAIGGRLWSIMVGSRRDAHVVERTPTSSWPSITRTGMALSTDARLRASAGFAPIGGQSTTGSRQCSGCSATTAIVPMASTDTVPIRKTRILVNGASVVATRKVQSHGQTVETPAAECLDCGRAITDPIDALPMPRKYVREMLADWMGAGRAYQGEYPKSIEEWKWWQENKDQIVLHESSRLHLTDAIVDWFHPTASWHPDDVLERIVWGEPHRSFEEVRGG